MRVAEKLSDDPHVSGPDSSVGRIMAGARSRIGRALLPLQRGDRHAPRSVNALPSRLGAELRRSDADVINLHWVCGEFLAIEDVRKIDKPLVWTLHDTWPIGGAEHYPDCLSSPRYTRAYSHASRPPQQHGLDLDAWVWRRKMRNWREPIHLVAPSRWMADQARSSTLTVDWPVHVIPNPVPVETYRPWPKAMARQAFQLPEGVLLVLFGAVGGGKDPRKGFDLLEGSLRHVAEVIPGFHGVVFGQSAPANDGSGRFPTHYVGHLHDDISLALLYSAADIVVVPSRIDNLPQTATEAQACGVPVIAFDTGGLGDTVVHDETGLLVEPFSEESLADAIASLLGDEAKRTSFGVAARSRAEKLWSPAAIVDKYLAVYSAAQRSGAAP
jgi:glycosyltransferase involved in cell wall biosynthesis